MVESQQSLHEIVITCQVMQEIGFGITPEMVGNVVMDYLKIKAGRILLQMTGQVMTGGWDSCEDG